MLANLGNSLFVNSIRAKEVSFIKCLHFHTFLLMEYMLL